MLKSPKLDSLTDYIGWLDHHHDDIFKDSQNYPVPASYPAICLISLKSEVEFEFVEFKDFV